MLSNAPSRVVCAVALLLLITVQPAVAGSRPTAEEICTDGTDWSGLPDDLGRSVYTAGFEDGSTADWTGGDVFPIGTEGQCSLGVVDGRTATLNRTVDASRGAVVGTLDVGDGGALRLVTANGSDAAVALRNRVEANDRSVALVIRNATGAVEYRLNTSTATGRFFDFQLRWGPNGTVELNLGTVDTAESNVWDVDVSTSTRPSGYRVGLSAEAYLDRIGIVRPAPPADESGPDIETVDGSEREEFDFGPSESDESDGDGESGGDGSGPVGFVGIVMLVFGLPGAVWPYEVARFGEQWDAIGSKTPAEEVEPADWNVRFTRFTSGGMAVIGAFMLALAIA